MRRRRRGLSRGADFDRVYRHGWSTSSRHFVLYAFPRESTAEQGPSRAQGALGDRDARLGVSVGKRVGGAVERNLVKRLLREAFWSLGDRLRAGYDYVVVARPDASGLAKRNGLDGFKRSLEALIEKAGRAGGRQAGERHDPGAS